MTKSQSRWYELDEAYRPFEVPMPRPTPVGLSMFSELSIMPTNTKFNHVSIQFLRWCHDETTQPYFYVRNKIYGKADSFRYARNMYEKQRKQFATYEEASEEFHQRIFDITSFEKAYCATEAKTKNRVRVEQHIHVISSSYRLSEDVSDWLADRAHTRFVNPVIGHYLVFKNQNDAFEFKLRWG